MNQINSILPVLALSIPLMGALLIVLVNKQVNLLTALTTLLTCLLIAAMYPFIKAGKILSKTFIIFKAPVTGFPNLLFSFRVDALGFFVGLIAAVIWMLATFFASYPAGNARCRFCWRFIHSVCFF